MQVINNFPQPLADADRARGDLQPGRNARLSTRNKSDRRAGCRLPISAQSTFPPISPPCTSSRLELRDKTANSLSSNFYWRAQPDQPAAKPAGQLELRLPGQYDDLTALNQLPMVTLTAQVKRADANGQRTLTVAVHNPSPNIALMAHLQLRRKSGERVLPVFYSDNYISLAPNETKTITIEAAVSDFNGEDALVVFDGWNVTVAPASFSGAAVAPNLDAQPDHSPASGLLYQTAGLR